VVNHDGRTDRVGGVRADMEATPWELLREIVLYDTDGTKDRYDLRLPSLENYISICKKYEKYCVLELKSVFTPEETAAFIEIIKGYDYLDHVIFISFHYEDLLNVRAILPDQPCQFLTGDNSDELIAKLVADRLDIDILHTALTEERVQAMHKAGITINCWTVDDPVRGEELAAWGVDHITSNILQGING
jgi:glycerophosphoryl diester phosphodiesterase